MRNLQLALLTSFLLFLFTGTAWSFVEADLQKLKEAKVCTGCDLSGADLKGMSLLGADLTGSDLSHANLEGANLHHAKVDGVNFKETILSGASWIDGCECEYDSIGECVKF